MPEVASDIEELNKVGFMLVSTVLELMQFDINRAPYRPVGFFQYFMMNDQMHKARLADARVANNQDFHLLDC
jgi:hypothetical protein